MTFIESQTKFKNLHLDSRTTWVAGWDNNKEALNDGYKEVYNKARQDRSLQEILKSAKTLITVTDKVWPMPTDFLQPVKLYFKVWTSYSEIDIEYFPYRYIRVSGVYKVIFDENPANSVYSEYIPKITNLDLDEDVIVLPDDFDWDIVNYALVEYFRQQRDWGNVWNALQYAEWKVKETVDNFWLE